MQQTIKQHYVPEVYLKQFKDNQNDMVWCCKTKSEYKEKIKRYYPSQICYSPYFYEIEKSIGTKTPVNYIENEWRNYENKWIDFIGHVNNRNPKIKNFEFRKVVFTIITLKLRNLSIRKLYNSEYAKEIVNNSVEDTINELERILKCDLSNIKRDAKKNIEEDENQGKNFHNNNLLSVLKGKNNSTSYQICERLLENELHILETSKQMPFITSDNPGFFLDCNGQVHNLKFIDECGKVDFGGFFLALTPEKCLFLSPKRDNDYSKTWRKLKYAPADSIMEKGKSFVEQYNLHTLDKCNDSIFSNDKEALEKSIIKFKRLREV